MGGVRRNKEPGTWNKGDGAGIQYAKTSDGVKIAFWEMGEGPQHLAFSTSAPACYSVASNESSQHLPPARNHIRRSRHRYRAPRILLPTRYATPPKKTSPTSATANSHARSSGSRKPISASPASSRARASGSTNSTSSPNFRGWASEVSYWRRQNSRSPTGLRLYTYQQNTRARAFYEARGFTNVEFNDKGREEQRPDVLMEWRP